MTSAPSDIPSVRPRAVTAAFWLWLVSAVLLVSYGLFVVTVALAEPAAFLRVSGGILIVTGLGLGYLAGKSRVGDWRFARAAVALSLGLVVFVSILLAIQMLGILIAPVVLFLIVAAGLVTRTTTANAWFAAQGAGDSRDV